MVSWLSLPFSDNGPVSGRSKPSLSGVPAAAALAPAPALAAGFAAAEPDPAGLRAGEAAAAEEAGTELLLTGALAEIVEDGAVDCAGLAPPQADSRAGRTTIKAQCFGFIARILPHERAKRNTENYDRKHAVWLACALSGPRGWCDPGL